MSDDKKTPAEVAMEKDCILLVAAKIIVEAIAQSHAVISVKCTGPACAQYGIVFGIHRCGLIK